MLTYINGDILTPNTIDRLTFVCHQVNCQGVMGSGLAKQVKEKHPRAYEAYRNVCAQYSRETRQLLGAVHEVSTDDQYNYRVANIFGQDCYGRDGKQYTEYLALERAFCSIALHYPDAVVRIPYKMGCGLGGGDWEVVLELIQRVLVDNGVDVEIWKLS